MDKINTKLKFLHIVASPPKSWLSELKERKRYILALKCTFWGQNRLNIYNKLLMIIQKLFPIHDSNLFRYFLDRQCNIGDWFVLYQLRKNTDKHFYCLLLKKMAKSVNPKSENHWIRLGKWKITWKITMKNDLEKCPWIKKLKNVS